MNTSIRVTTTVAVMGILSLGSLTILFLALHDIHNDYASPKVIQEQTRLAAGSLPDWTECPLEWTFVKIGFWLIVAFHITFAVSLIRQALKKVREEEKTEIVTSS